MTVLAGASDPDGDVVMTASAGPAGNGSVVINADGTVIYTPAPDFKGDDTFPFTVTDGQGGYATAMVTVTVANAAPVPADDHAATLPNTPTIVNASANDVDPNLDPLTIVAVTQPVVGRQPGW